MNRMPWPAPPIEAGPPIPARERERAAEPRSGAVLAKRAAEPVLGAAAATAARLAELLASREGIPGAAATLLILLTLAAAAVPARAATVSGFVYSGSTGETLDYANVFLQGTALGDMANEKGYYVITGIPAGTHTLAFSYMGYSLETREMTLEADEEIVLSVELTPTVLEMDAVEVKGEKSELVLEPSKMTLRTKDLARVPRTVEADLFRAVQALPGVSTLSDFSSGLYVRGGSPDQNLILLDDMDVYNPSHLFGFFSTFNVDAVKSVDLQKAGFSASYGDRLSSVLDVRNRDGNRKELQGTARVSMIGASATVDGPWSHGSWMLAGRRTYIETLARSADIDLPYYFYDFHARVNYDLARDDRTSLSYFRSRDRLDWENPGLDVLLDWGNDTWSAQWTHLFHTRLYSHFVLGGSRFLSTAEASFQDFSFRAENEITDLKAKGKLSYTPNEDHRVDFGFEAKAMDFSWTREAGKEDRLRFAYDGFQAAAYGEDNWKLSRDWQLQTGLRLSYYSEGDYLRLGPRVTLRRQLSEMLAAHATYGRFNQFLNLVYEEGASFADMWFPVDKTLRPGSADHYILGIEIGPYESFDLSIEGYYKKYRNLVEFSEEFSNSLIDEEAELGDAFNSGEGEAFGADVYLRNKWAGFEGWIGYAYGRTERTIEGFNYGHTYDPAYDRRHQITIMQERALGQNWRLSANFKYGTGQPTTLAAGRYTVRDITGREYDLVLAGPYNKGRLPDYHRLDLGISYLTHYKGLTIEPNLQIINAYGRDNVYIRVYDTDENPVKVDDVTMLPMLPTLGVTVRF